MNESTQVPERVRCSWPGNHLLSINYHDHEWGVPQHDDSKLFEMLTLEGAQAGLSWQTILNKREGYRALFAGFDVESVAAFGDADIERLVQNPAIVRHRGKIISTVNNAGCIRALWELGLTLDEVLWNAVDGNPITNHWRKLCEIPASTPQSYALSKRLKKLGFRFVGETTCYALMQAAGLVNDHVVGCYRHAQCRDVAMTETHQG